MKDLEIEIDAKQFRAMLGVKDGEDGKDATPIDEKKLKKEILKKVLDEIPQADTMNQRGYTVSAGGGQRLRFLSNGVEVSAHVTEINFSTNLTPVYDGNGRITITSSAASTTYTETPSGLINGSNVTYTTTNTITTVLNFHINGMYIHPGEYTTTGTTITFLTALDASLSGTGFTIVYV